MKRLAIIAFAATAMAAGSTAGASATPYQAPHHDAVRVGPGGDLFPSGATAYWRVALASLSRR
jgi:hypothetical protein